MAVTGAQPLAITNCLNFGNPERPVVMWQFAESIRGIRDACLAFDTPVTGGNVSFYNESADSAIWPTPVIGMLGLLEDHRLRVPSGFPRAGLSVYLLGETYPELGGSEFAEVVLGVVAGRPPALDLVKERALHSLLVAAARADVLASAHDCADGGLAIALVESAIAGGHGFAATIATDLPPHVALFSESASRAVVESRPSTSGSSRSLRPRTGCPRGTWVRPAVRAWCSTACSKHRLRRCGRSTRRPSRDSWGRRSEGARPCDGERRVVAPAASRGDVRLLGHARSQARRAAARTMRRLQIDRFAATLDAGDRHVPDAELAEAFDANWERFEERWIANTGQYTPADTVDFVAARVGTALDDALRARLIDGFREVGELVPLRARARHRRCARDVPVGRRAGSASCATSGLTPAPTLRERLRSFGLLDRFDSWAFSDETGWFKPAPEAFAPALEGMGLGVDRADAAAHVGDNPRTDVAGALALGMVACGTPASAMR